MNIKNQEYLIAKHELWLRGELGGARLDLSKTDLSRINLSGANLTGANLSGASLTAANLSGTNLSRANLTGANLFGANLSDVNLVGANLFRANLTEANLSGANLTETFIKGIIIQNTNFTGTQYENDIPVIINTEFYSIVKTKAYIKISCETHTPLSWSKFSDAEIAKMDVNAAEFWAKYKSLVLGELK